MNENENVQVFDPESVDHFQLAKMVLTRAAHAAEVDSIQCLSDEVFVHAHWSLRLDVASLLLPPMMPARTLLPSPFPCCCEYDQGLGPSNLRVCKLGR